MSFLHGIEKLGIALLKERRPLAWWLYPKPSSPFQLGWIVMLSTAMYCSLPSLSNRLYSPTTTRYELGWLTRENKRQNKIKEAARLSLVKMEQRRLRRRDVSQSENCWIMSEPEDAVSCSHDMEPTNDGASTDVIVVTVVVWVLLKRHLEEDKNPPFKMKSGFSAWRAKFRYRCLSTKNIKKKVTQDSAFIYNRSLSNWNHNSVSSHLFVPATSRCWVEHCGHRWPFRSSRKVPRHKSALKADTQTRAENVVMKQNCNHHLSKHTYQCRTTEWQTRSCWSRQEHWHLLYL